MDLVVWAENSLGHLLSSFLVATDRTLQVVHEISSKEWESKAIPQYSSSETPNKPQNTKLRRAISSRELKTIIK